MNEIPLDYGKKRFSELWWQPSGLTFIEERQSGKKLEMHDKTPDLEKQ